MLQHVSFQYVDPCNITLPIDCQIHLECGAESLTPGLQNCLEHMNVAELTVYLERLAPLREVLPYRLGRPGCLHSIRIHSHIESCVRSSAQLQDMLVLDAPLLQSCRTIEVNANRIVPGVNIPPLSFLNSCSCAW